MRTILQLVLIDETGDSYYRMRWPGETLCTQDEELRVINLDAQSKERLTWAKEVDLLVLYQSNDLDMIPVIQHRKEKGLKTLVEYNDNFYAPPPASPVFGPWSSPLMWTTYETIMKQADHISVTGQGLYNLFSDVVDIPISILKNHLPDPPTDFSEVWEESEELRIGWAGSVGHMGDLIALLPTLEDFCLKHDNVRLCFMGNESIPTQLKIPNSQYSYTPWGSMSEYYTFLKNLHIGIAPLGNSPYNQCRSDVKALEYASRGALPILQDLLPYQDLIQAGITPRFSSRAELQSLLHKYHKDRKALYKEANKAFTTVTEERAAKNNDERLKLYQSLMPKKKSKFKTKLSMGYHEIEGENDSTLQCSTVTLEVEKLLKAKDFEKALQYIEKHKGQLSYDPQLNLLYCETLKRLDSKDVEKFVVYNLDAYPHDLRFMFFFLQLKKAQADKTGIWYNIIEKLELSSKASITFFEKQCVKVFTAHIAKNKDLLPLCQAMTDLYPNNIQLLTSLAQTCFEHEAFKEAEEYSLRAISLLEMLEREFDKPQDALQLLRTIAEASEYSLSLR